MTNPNQAPAFGVMDQLANTRTGQLLADLAMAAAVVAPGAGVPATALAEAQPARASDVPAKLSKLAIESRQIVTPDCQMTDSPDPAPQWHERRRFTTANGKQAIHAVRPGSVMRFEDKVAAGNVEVFDLGVKEYFPSSHPQWFSSKGLKILKHGSHPAWFPVGGAPQWVVKNLCHWQDKRNISFLVKVADNIKTGGKACLETAVNIRTSTRSALRLARDCVKVK